MKLWVNDMIDFVVICVSLMNNDLCIELLNITYVFIILVILDKNLTLTTVFQVMTNEAIVK